MTIILISILALVLAIATFIEEKYDTETAKQVVYHAKWFEFIFLLLILNLFGHIKQYNLLSRKKWAGLLFHTAFIIIIIGAAVTRYFGFEGTMPIREGQASNIIYTTGPYLQVSIGDKAQKPVYNKPFVVSNFTQNSLHVEFETGSKNKIAMEYKEFIPNAVQKIIENVPGGKNTVELIVANDNGQQTYLIEDGNAKAAGNISIGFNNRSGSNTFGIVDENGVLKFISTSEIIVGNMSMQAEDTIKANTLTEFQNEKIYA